MKKFFLFFALLAGIAVMTGCQKDQDVVTLKAVISQDTKAYFGDDGLTPYWNGGDEVYIKGLTDFSTNIFGLTGPYTTVATIPGVPASDVYSAIFPARMVISMETPTPSVRNDNNEIVTPAGTSALVYFDPHQYYKETGGHQQVDMPMGAVTEDNTLIFKNLCSIIRLNVTNGLATSTYRPNLGEPDVHVNALDFDVKRLTVQAFGSYIAGFANVTLSNSADPVINMNVPNHILSDNVLSVYKEDNGSMGTIYKNENDGPTSKTFDIVVPPFSSTDDFVLEVEMYTRHTDEDNNTFFKPLGYYEHHFNRSVSVGRNKIVPIDLNVDRYKIYDYAYIEDGPTFNSDLRSILTNQVTWIKFNHNPGTLNQAGITAENQWDVTTPTGWVELQAPNSPHKIYGYVTSNPTVLEINSFGSSLYCNSDCSHMFEDCDHFTNLQWTETVLFVTEDVTDMSYMFAGCSSMTTLPNIGSFNTTNVTTMAHMFDGCYSMGALDLSSYNTHNLVGTGMVGMFNGCSALQTLNLSSFTTEQITDMTDLFNGCRSLKGQSGLNISQFDMSNVTTLTNMCTNLNANNTSYNRCAIICNDDTKKALLGTDVNNVNHPEVTGIDPTKVYFPNQGETPPQK